MKDDFEDFPQGEDVLFHEVNNIYFRIVAHLIESAETSPLTVEGMEEAVRRFGFGETTAEFFRKFNGGAIPIFYRRDDGTFGTPLKFAPRPLALVERRWLAAIAEDERMGLFLDDEEIAKLKASLGGAEPLYKKEDFRVVDASNDPDPFTEARYRQIFRTLLGALRQGKCLRVLYEPRDGRANWQTVEPTTLQYSNKDDKFRLFGAALKGRGQVRRVTMNVSRILEAEMSRGARPSSAGFRAEPETRHAVMMLTDARGTVERAMVHFASYTCTSRLGGTGEIIMNVEYGAEDEMELLIRVLSYGPLIRVTEPKSLVAKIKERLRRQAQLGTKWIF